MICTLHLAHNTITHTSHTRTPKRAHLKSFMKIYSRKFISVFSFDGCVKWESQIAIMTRILIRAWKEICAFAFRVNQLMRINLGWPIKWLQSNSHCKISLRLALMGFVFIDWILNSVETQKRWKFSDWVDFSSSVYSVSYGNDNNNKIACLELP